MRATAYTVVVPTVGRDRLADLLGDLARAHGPRPSEVIVVDDRVRPSTPITEQFRVPDGTRVLLSGGRGPAAARNTGRRAADTPWVAFLDDDVRLGPAWCADLVADLERLGPDVAASQARIDVPLPGHRRPTDDERDTAGLADARWITADMAYRADALAAVGGFDERFGRAYREDADLAVRVRAAGFRLAVGTRTTTHPVRARGPLASLRAQAGNADDALMRRKHGRRWRDVIDAGPGRPAQHATTVAAAVAALAALLSGRRRPAAAAGAVWLAATAEFAARRIAPGPRTPREIGTMLLTSVLIPPAAVAHRLRGELRARRTPAAVLFDRDDTLIVDVPYLADPDGVRPVPGAVETLDRLRASGIPVGIVSNQSGVARGLITPDGLAAVNARVDELLGPFGTWQVCPHGAYDGCGCRKPAPGLVHRAAEALGVDVRRCVVLGDTGADVVAARTAGARAVLVPTGRTLPSEVADAHRYAAVARDLDHGVALALGGGR